MAGRDESEWLEVSAYLAVFNKQCFAMLMVILLGVGVLVISIYGVEVAFVYS